MVLTIESLGIDTVEVAHAARKVRLGRSHQKVVVIAHLAVRVYVPVKSLRDLIDDGEPFPTVVVVEEDVGSSIASGRYVVLAIRKLDRKGRAVRSSR